MRAHYNLEVLHKAIGNLELTFHFYKNFSRLGMVSHPPLLLQKIETHIKTFKYF